MHFDFFTLIELCPLLLDLLFFLPLASIVQNNSSKKMENYPLDLSEEGKQCILFHSVLKN